MNGHVNSQEFCWLLGLRKLTHTGGLCTLITFFKRGSSGSTSIKICGGGEGKNLRGKKCKKKGLEACKNLSFMCWNCQIWANFNTFEFFFGGGQTGGGQMPHVPLWHWHWQGGLYLSSWACHLYLWNHASHIFGDMNWCMFVFKYSIFEIIGLCSKLNLWQLHYCFLETDFWRSILIYTCYNNFPTGLYILLTYVLANDTVKWRGTGTLNEAYIAQIDWCTITIVHTWHDTTEISSWNQMNSKIVIQQGLGKTLTDKFEANGEIHICNKGKSTRDMYRN